MRNGKDGTYRLPILVCAANNYLKMQEYIDRFRENTLYQLRLISFHYKILKNQNFSITIPRSSYYRVVNQLVNEGYLGKKFTLPVTNPIFFITIKGLDFLINSNR